MPLYIADYRKDTAHLSAAEHGAYLLLIMHYWATGELPDDDRQLARIACMTPPEWKRTRPVVERFFDGKWKHSRVDRELVRAEEKHRKRAEAGKRGGKAKAGGKQNPSNASSGAIAGLYQPQPESQELASASSGARAPDLKTEAGVIELRTAIAKAFNDANIPLIPDTSRAAVWLAQGYRAEIVVAVIRERLATKPNINNLKYFDGLIAEAHKVPAPPPPVDKPAMSDDAWREAVAAWKRSGRWLFHRQSDPPDEPGTKVPQHILAEFGMTKEAA